MKLKKLLSFFILALLSSIIVAGCSENKDQADQDAAAHGHSH
ncbi:MAG: hypothetical protein QM479_12460 [Pseudomonadota bacterium]